MPAKKAAAAAGGGKKKVLKKLGLTLNLPPAVPAEVLFVVDQIKEGGQLPYLPLLRAYVGDEQLEKIRAANLTLDQFVELYGAVQEKYRVDLGE